MPAVVYFDVDAERAIDMLRSKSRDTITKLRSLVDEILASPAQAEKHWGKRFGGCRAA